MKKDLFIDTNFGLGNFDYINCEKDELDKRLLYERRVERDIDIRFDSMIRLSLYGYGNVKKNKHRLLTNDIGCFIFESNGPDQSYYSEIGEYNSIEIYISILRIMWQDYITHNYAKRLIRLRKLVRKNIKNEKKYAFLKIKQCEKKDNCIHIYIYVLYYL
jgi:hypothetical protein